MKRLLLLGIAVVVCMGASPRKTYLKTVGEQTRKLVIYHEFATALLLRATYLDAPFRAVLAEERKRLMGATEDDHQDFVERMERDQSAYHDVVFAADSNLEAGDRFGQDDDGWVVRLFADGTEEPLVDLHRVRKPNPLHHSLYPQINNWAELWIARFERTVADPSAVELTIGSGYGHGTLEWSLDDPS